MRESNRSLRLGSIFGDSDEASKIIESRKNKRLNEVCREVRRRASLETLHYNSKGNKIVLGVHTLPWLKCVPKGMRTMSRVQGNRNLPCGACPGSKVR